MLILKKIQREERKEGGERKVLHYKRAKSKTINKKGKDFRVSLHPQNQGLREGPVCLTCYKWPFLRRLKLQPESYVSGDHNVNIHVWDKERKG